MNTKGRIIGYINKNTQARPGDLKRELRTSRGMIHRALKQLVTEGQIAKVGKPPMVFYVRRFPEELSDRAVIVNFASDQRKFLEENYSYMSSAGINYKGSSGFTEFLIRSNQTDVAKRVTDDYIAARKEANDFLKPGGYMDATSRVGGIVKDLHLTRVMHADFYSLPRFGKTNLGNLVYQAKQSRDLDPVTQIAELVSKPVQAVIKKYHIDAVGYIPHSIKRQVEVLPELSKILRVDLPEVELVKIFPGKPIQQKSLRKYSDREVNARETIYIKSTYSKYNNVLLIDDAVGSGASMNETAKKLLDTGVAKQVFGYAIVGSYKGFDVLPVV